MPTENQNALIHLAETEVLCPQVVELVSSYLGFAKKSAENIIGLARTLVTAKSNLSSEDLEVFCKEVGLDKKGPTYRKLTLIGERAERFDPYLDQMPSAWTTVYQLAMLSDQDFSKVANSKAFSPFMPAKKIAEIAPQDRKRKTRQLALTPASCATNTTTEQAYTIMIDLTMIPDEDKDEVRNEIYILQNNYSFGLSLSDAFDALNVESRHKSPFQMEQRV